MESATKNIVDACSRGARGCKALAEVTRKAPEDTADDQAFIKASKAFGQKLSDLKLEQEKVSKARDALVSAVGEQVKLMEDMNEIERERDSAEKAMDTAVAPEDDLVKAINGFCGA